MVEEAAAEFRHFLSDHHALRSAVTHADQHLWVAVVIARPKIRAEVIADAITVRVVRVVLLGAAAHDEVLDI
jgi:hypothetical protein